MSNSETIDKKKKSQSVPFIMILTAVIFLVWLIANAMVSVGGGAKNKGTPLTFYDLEDGEVYHKIDDWPIVLLKGSDDKYRAYYLERDISDLPKTFIVKKTETKGGYKIILVPEDATIEE